MEEEPGWDCVCGLGVAFDSAPAEFGDQLEGSLEGGGGDALTAMSFADRSRVG